MTTDEILKGKQLFVKVNSIYELHPEYKRLNKLNKQVDRYEEFVAEMMEKYGASRANIVSQIHYLQS